MTIYYDPEQSPLFSTLYCTHTVFALLLKAEFWSFIALHLAAVGAMKYYEVDASGMNWEAVSSMQVFMMFMLIFYNNACYDRHIAYYSACMSVLRQAVFFVQEICTSMPFEETEQHRLISSRYVLAAVYLFYMSVTGGTNGYEWAEVRRKGLLTMPEVRMLQGYPGKVPTILMSWALHVVVIGLELDVFWTPHSAHIGHLHNRLNEHALGMLKASNKVAYLLAMPIPFPYYNLMNFLLLFFMVVMAFALSTLGTFLSVFVFGFLVLIHMGMRQISIDLSDPFEDDANDFPVNQFLDYVFDHSVGLLEAFSHPLAYKHVMTQVDVTQHFSEEEMLNSIKPVIQYQRNHASRRYVWEQDRPLHKFEKHTLKKVLSHAIVDPNEVAGHPKDLQSHCVCGKVFMPGAIMCSRCGKHRELPPGAGAHHEHLLADNPEEQLVAEESDVFKNKASAKSLADLDQRRADAEILRDAIGAARLRLASLQAALRGLGTADLRSFAPQLDVAMRLMATASRMPREPKPRPPELDDELLEKDSTDEAIDRQAIWEAREIREEQGWRGEMYAYVGPQDHDSLTLKTIGALSPESNLRSSKSKEILSFDAARMLARRDIAHPHLR